MKDYTKELGFWKRLESFVKEVQVNDPCSEEEQEMIMHCCKLKILDLQNVSKSFTAKFVVNELEDCEHLDDAIMYFKQQM